MDKYYITLQLKKGDNVYVDVEISGGNDDIKFYIVDPNGYYVRPPSKIYSHYTYSFTAAEDGTYYLWFDNSFSILTSKYVNVELTLKPIGTVKAAVAKSAPDFYQSDIQLAILGILMSGIAVLLKIILKTIQRRSHT